MLGKRLANIVSKMLPFSLCKHILNLRKARLTIVPSPNIAVPYFGLDPKGISTKKLVWAATKNLKNFKASATDLVAATASYRILNKKSWLLCSFSASFLKAELTWYAKYCPASGPHTPTLFTETIARPETLNRLKQSTPWTWSVARWKDNQNWLIKNNYISNWWQVFSSFSQILSGLPYTEISKWFLPIPMMRAQKELFFFFWTPSFKGEGGGEGRGKFQNTEFLAEKMLVTVLETMINVKRLKELNKWL